MVKKNVYHNVEENSAKYSKMMKDLLSEIDEKHKLIELMIPKNVIR